MKRWKFYPKNEFSQEELEVVPKKKFNEKNKFSYEKVEGNELVDKAKI